MVTRALVMQLLRAAAYYGAILAAVLAFQGSIWTLYALVRAL